ncbi:MAG: replication initiator [Acidimicrobiales bacterium]
MTTSRGPGGASNEVMALSYERSAGELSKLADRIERAGGCERPIRLQASGAGSPSAGEPDGVLLVACKSRREFRCRPCAITYRGDAREIVRSGIEGGKGVPESVSSHPSIFLTLTAPGFGAVHRATGNRCHLGPPGRCPHGRATHCLSVHEEKDELVGSPLCPHCYDYEGAVLFNGAVGELWRRVTIYAKRHLAYLLHRSEKELDGEVRLSYVKVAELQRRGVVHLHAVVRADRAGDEMARPPGEVTAGLLSEALVKAVRAVKLTVESGGVSRVFSFGEQLSTESLDHEKGSKLAGYLSKYLVKEASGTGALDHRLREGEIELLQVTDHVRRMLETAWALGADPEHEGLRRWAHSLGFTGHLMTKSRRYSTTFIRLRAIRQAWRIEQQGEDVEEQPSSDLVWVFTGAGYRKEIDAILARTYAQGRMASRREYWAERHERTAG